MATSNTFTWIFLGNSATAIDPTEGNTVAENAALLNGTTWGSTGNPLFSHVTSVTTNDINGDTSLNQDNTVSNETFTTNIGAGTQTYTFDASAIYNVTMTYADGSTVSTTAVLAQDTAGNLYLAPEKTNDAVTTQQQALPIVSMTLNSLVGNDYTGMASSRWVTGFDDGIVQGTSGNDLINSSYVEPIANGSDKIDNNDAGLAGSSGNDDYVIAGAGNDTVLSGLGNDTVDAGTGNDSVDGGAGNDVLYGGAGNDTLLGNTGDDLLNGGAGADSINGGTGNDTVDYSTSSAAVSVNLATQSATGGDATGDTLVSIEAVIGSAFNDTLVGSTAAESMYGGAGNDSIVGSTGADSLDGGTGNDTIDYGASTAAVSVNLGTSSGSGGYAAGDTLVGFEAVVGSAFNDTLIGSSGSDSLYGGAGNDSLVGGAGADLLDGGTGKDTVDYSASSAAVSVNLATGSNSGGDAAGDTLTSIEAVIGSAFNDTLFGGAGSDSLFGGAGNDSIAGGAGADSLVGGTGNDTVDYSTSGAAVSVNLATQTATGGDATGDTISGFEAVVGSAFNDTLVGSSGSDSLYGGAGNDSLVGGAGADLLDGGTGNDTVDYSASSAGVSVDLSTGHGAGGDAAGDTLTSIEAVIGSNFDDTLSGGSGSESLFGGAGNDHIFGSAGADSLDGGAGTDTVDYSASSAGVSVDLSTGHGAGGDAAGDTLSGFEAVIGSAHDDMLTAGAGDDSLYGGAGNDLLVGGSGHDLLDGGDGNDTFSGGTGPDTMLGGSGADFFHNISIGSVVDGGETGNDNDTLDLTSWGKSLTNILFDPNNHENGTVQFLDAQGHIIGSMSFSNIEHMVPCFTPGTLIETDRGAMPVESVRVGTRVLTRDSGYQPVRWAGRRDLGAGDTVAMPALCPVLIHQGALGPGLPERDMIVSPQHRMLLTGANAELIFGEGEVLAAAVHLVGLPGISRAGAGPVSYIHIMFDRHEIVRSDGAWSESFQPGDQTFAGMDEPQRAELLSIFPDLASAEGRGAYGAARICLKAHEARLLMSA